MSRISEYLISLRKGRGFTQREVADRTGLGINTISNHELGNTSPNYSARKLYSQIYGLTMTEFEAGWRGGGNRCKPVDANGDWIPVINKAPAGEPMNYEESFPDSSVGIEYIARSPDMPVVPDMFAFVVVGDSMTPIFQPNDCVVVATIPAENIRDGEAVFVRFGASRNHTCTFKRVFRLDRDRVELRADNGRYSPIVVLKIDIDRMAPVFEVRKRFERFKDLRHYVEPE